MAMGALVSIVRPVLSALALVLRVDLLFAHALHRYRMRLGLISILDGTRFRNHFFTGARSVLPFDLRCARFLTNIQNPTPLDAPIITLVVRNQIARCAIRYRVSHFPNPDNVITNVEIVCESPADRTVMRALTLEPAFARPGHRFVFTKTRQAAVFRLTVQ